MEVHFCDMCGTKIQNQGNKKIAFNVGFYHRQQDKNNEFFELCHKCFNDIYKQVKSKTKGLKR